MTSPSGGEDVNKEALEMAYLFNSKPAVGHEGGKVTCLARAALLLAIDAHEHPYHFARDHLIVFIKPLQIRNQLDIRRVKARRWVAPRHRLRIFTAAKTQPFGGYAQPLRQGAQLFLRRNRFADQPFARRMHSDGSAGETYVEFPRKLRWAVG